MARRLLVFLLLAIVSLTALAAEKPAASTKIDTMINERLAKAKVPASPLADDAAFCRRVYLDITGRIPTAEQALAYIEDKNPQKRFKLVDSLLQTSEYGQHFAGLWRDLLVDRTEDSQRLRSFFSHDFASWLAGEFNAGKAWDVLVTAMLTAEGEVKAKPAGVFILANSVNDFPRPEIIAGTAGKLFMGLHIKCAQCHNHPYVESWTQDDFWGVAAFFGQIRDIGLPVNGPTIKPNLSEKPNPDDKAEERYRKRMLTNGQIPALKGEKIAIPTIADPTKTMREISAKFFHSDEPAPQGDGPFRPAFAKWLTAKSNPYFAKASVNRIWAHFFARGIVTPIDDLSPDHAPTHPELLDFLADEFKRLNYSHREFLRVVCCTDAYARSSKSFKENESDKELYSHQAIKVLSPEQTVDSFCVATNRKVPYLQERERQTLLFATKEADDSPVDYNHGIPQFLFQMNGLTSSLPNPGGLSPKEPEKAIEKLYANILSRRPTADEVKRMKVHVAKSKTPNEAYKDIQWVLLNSAEFILNR